MLKKIGLLTLTLFLGASALCYGCGDDSSSESSSLDASSEASSAEASSEYVPIAYESLNHALEDVSGVKEIAVGDLDLRTGVTKEIRLGSDALEEAIVNGWNEEYETKAEITAIGGGKSIVRANNDGKLTFKNVVFYNETTFYEDRLYAYLEFGGKLRFENCDFECHIFLKDDTQAEFVNCNFRSSESDRYAVWVADGNVSFTDCTFTGYRGLKLHEEEDWDIENVTLTDCTFKDITVKPGIAIGDIVKDPENTFVTVTGCLFENCNDEWDKVHSLEGIPEFYESDTLTSTFGWSESNNFVGLYPITEEDIEYNENLN